MPRVVVSMLRSQLALEAWGAPHHGVVVLFHFAVLKLHGEVAVGVGGFGEGQRAAGFAVEPVGRLNVVVVLAGQAQHVGRAAHPLVERGQERWLVDDDVVVVFKDNEVRKGRELHREAQR